MAIASLGACLSLSGCVTRYARIIALSSPPLANVKVVYPVSLQGPTPAYIDERARFFLFGERRRTYELIFDHDKCTAKVVAVPITNWGKTAEDGPLHVTTGRADLACTNP
jgi:hypothetical protein